MQVQFQFDVRTVALFIALTFLVEAAAIGAQAFLIRELKQYQGVVAALIANLSVALGIILRLFVNQFPDFLSVVLANLLMLLGLGLFYVALSQFTGLSYSKALVAVVMGVSLVLLLYFTYANDSIAARMIVVSLGAVAMVTLLIHQLVRTRRTSLKLSASLMLIAFLSLGTFLILRTISLALDPPQDLSFATSRVQSATYLMMFALSFFWSTGFILMISQRLRNDLMEIATMDVLTHIPNRRATQIFLEKELSRARRNHGEFSVLLIDIDKFKQVNDKWGHAVGDHVLVKTAAIFQSMIRRQDWVGRWGGEEFLMVLPGSPTCDAPSLAERVRSEIAGRTYSHGSASLGITISIGIACARPTDQIDQVLRKADKALYRAKQTRNTVSVAG